MQGVSDEINTRKRGEYDRINKTTNAQEKRGRGGLFKNKKREKTNAPFLLKNGGRRGEGMKQCVIGIDVGTSGTKTIAVDQEGKILASALASYPLYTPQAGWNEQAPEDWWQAAAETLKKVTGQLEDTEIIGIGLSGQMHGMVALDRDGRVVRRALLWNDQRTGAQCDEITQTAGGLNGLLSMTNNRMLTGFTGGKILWMRENEPENFAKTVKILNPKDYIGYQLTGEQVTEVSDASGTGLFDVKNRKFHEGLLAKLGLSADLFGRCIESTEIRGYVTKQAAEQTGLPEGVPVTGGGGDAVISTTAMGLTEPGRLGLVLGTSGVVATGLPAFMENPEGKLQVFCNTAPGMWHAAGITLSAAGSLAWFQNTFGQDKQRQAQCRGTTPFALWDQAAEVAGPGAHGLLFLPYLSGERCPVNDPDARGAFVGITALHTDGDFARAVLEGVAFSLKQVAELMEQMPGFKPQSEIVVSGGGSKSRLWRQIIADVFGLPVLQTYGAAEGGAFGAALVAGAGCGLWENLTSAMELLHVQDVTKPSKDAEKYQAPYQRYCKLYQALQALE